MEVALNMDRTVWPFDRQLQASTGSCTQACPQRSLSIHHAAVGLRPWQWLPSASLRGASFSGVLQFGLLYSGMDQNQMADRIHVSAGYMSRFLKGVAELWAKRLVRFMTESRSLAPLQWMADQVGCDVIVRDEHAAHIARLEAELAEARRAAA